MSVVDIPSLQPYNDGSGNNGTSYRNANGDDSYGKQHHGM